MLVQDNWVFFSCPLPLSSSELGYTVTKSICGPLTSREEKWLMEERDADTTEQKSGG